jgi:hypothetical protein
VSSLGPRIPDTGGLVAPFWFGFVGSGLTLALMWRPLGQVAHADQEKPVTHG